MKERIKIDLTFEVDLDPTPGFASTKESWIEFLRAILVNNPGIAHYNPGVRIPSRPENLTPLQIAINALTQWKIDIENGKPNTPAFNINLFGYQDKYGNQEFCPVGYLAYHGYAPDIQVKFLANGSLDHPTSFTGAVAESLGLESSQLLDLTYSSSNHTLDTVIEGLRKYL